MITIFGAFPPSSFQFFLERTIADIPFDSQIGITTIATNKPFLNTLKAILTERKEPILEHILTRQASKHTPLLGMIRLLTCYGVVLSPFSLLIYQMVSVHYLNTS